MLIVHVNAKKKKLVGSSGKKHSQCDLQDLNFSWERYNFKSVMCLKQDYIKQMWWNKCKTHVVYYFLGPY